MAGNKRWTENDLKVLKNEYGRTDISYLAERLGRSVDAIHWKASKEGISFIRELTVSQYNSIEQMLKEIQSDIADIKKALNINKIEINDVGKTTDDIIKNLYPFYPAYFVAEKLGKSEAYVNSRVHQLRTQGVDIPKKKDGGGKKQSVDISELDEYIINLYTSKTVPEIASIIGKTIYYVRGRIYYIRKKGVKLIKKRGRPPLL